MIEGKVAFITGVGRGQGRSHAIRMADEGADTASYAMATQENLTKRRCWSKRPAAAPSCPALTCVAARGCSAAVTSGVSELGRLDIVCANAGIMPVGRSIWQISARQCQDVIDINLTGVFNTLAVTVSAMRAAGNGGSIIVTASAAALRFGLHLGDYAAAKAGVIAWRKRWLIRLLRNGFA